jgi:ATP-dependent DNA helicase recG
MSLDDSVMYLKGVGPKRAELLKKLEIETVRELIYHIPRSYIDFTSPVPIADTVLEEMNVIKVRVYKKRAPDLIRKNMKIFRVICTDGADDITIVIYNSQYLYNSLKEDCDYILYGKVTGNLISKEMSSPMILEASSEDKILPIYPLTAGISMGIMRSCVKNAIERLKPGECETLPQSVQKKHGLIPADEAIRKIHFPADSAEISAARKRLAFDELLTLQLGMLTLRERSRELTSYSLSPKSLSPYYSSLPFELTGAQKKAIEECCADMTRESPMNRLILGDVGSGKTAVAAACCYFAYLNGYQSCLMVPTEILADQHYATLCGFLEPLGVKIVLLKGSMTAKRKSQIKQALAAGEYDLAVGTHALIQQSTEFKNLAIVITDEQHRFGVAQRDALAKKSVNPHRLVMSATPIPRTLALMIYGELDISLLGELPKGRLKIETYAVTGKLRERAYGFVKKQLMLGNQAYIVCPAIEESETGAADLKSVKSYAKSLGEGAFKGYRIAVLHGQLPADKKEKIMQDFKDGETDILVSTTVIEVGVDVPNATVMLIENADRFGLSQLHQLRGRVGRGKDQSYCILITDNVNEDSRKRLKALTATSDGFEISEMDLKLRGPGDFFGEAQHGLPRLKIADIVADSELLSAAGSEARNLHESGFLQTDDGKALAKRVQSLFEDGVKS